MFVKPIVFLRALVAVEENGVIVLLQPQTQLATLLLHDQMAIMVLMVM
jgi:hypothetical protein